MPQWIGSTLVQIMACRLFSAKSLSKPMLGYCQLGPLWTNFHEILVKIQIFSFMKMHLKIASVKWQPFCPGGDELTDIPTVILLWGDCPKSFQFCCNFPAFSQWERLLQILSDLIKTWLLERHKPHPIIDVWWMWQSSRAVSISG